MWKTWNDFHFTAPEFGTDRRSLFPPVILIDEGVLGFHGFGALHRFSQDVRIFSTKDAFQMEGSDITADGVGR